MNDKIKDLSEETILSYKSSHLFQKSDKFENDIQENMSLSSSQVLQCWETYVNQLKLSSNPSMKYLMVMHFTLYNYIHCVQREIYIICNVIFTQMTNSLDKLLMCPIELLSQIEIEEGFRVTYVELKNDQSMSTKSIT